MDITALIAALPLAIISATLLVTAMNAKALFASSSGAFRLLQRWREVTFNRSTFFWVVNIVFMAISSYHAALFFGSAVSSPTGLEWIGPYIGLAVSLVIDGITIVFMKARAEAVYKRDKKSAARYLRYVAASSALNTTANLYTDIEHFRAQDYNHVGALLLTIAPVVLSIFPLFLIAVSKAADEMINVKPLEKVNVEEFKKQEEKRVSLLEAQNAYLEREAKAERKRIEIETVQKENALLRKGKSKQKPPQVLVRRAHRLMFSWPWQKTDVNEIAQLRETIEKLQEKLEQQKVSSVVSTKTKQSEKQNDGTSVAENETKVDTNPTFLEEMNAYLSAQDRSTESHSAVSPDDDTNHITFLHTSDTKNDTKRDTKSGCGKAAKAARYIRNNPNIAPSELAKKASISVTYARRLLQQKDA